MPAPPNPYTERVSFDGRHDVDARTRAQINAVEGILGHAVRMPQGSWSFSPLSAGTHGGSGAADLVPTGPVTYRQLETACRCVGFAAWFRPWAGNYHVHCISIGNPYVAWLAALQVGAYHAGFDGLGRDARAGHDTGTRLYANAGVTWESYLAQHNGPTPQQPQPPGDPVLTGKTIAREKDQRITGGAWHYIAINDKDDVSFATGPGKIVSGVFEIAAPLKPGQLASIRWAVDDIDDRTGRTVTSRTTHTIATLTGFDAVPFARVIGTAPKGQTRRLRAQIHTSANVVIDHVSVTYYREP